jgi:hypothetical protein
LFRSYDVLNSGCGLLEWDDACDGLVRTVAREEEWKDREAQNDAVQWGVGAIGWEVTPPASPVSQVDVPRFRPWAVTSEQIAQGRTWPTEEEDLADRDRLAGRMQVEVSVEVHSSVGDLIEEHTACRCFLVFVLIRLPT